MSVKRNPLSDARTIIETGSMSQYQPVALYGFMS